MAISTRMSRNPVTPSAQSPSIGARPSSTRPSSVKNSMAASMSSTTMPTLSIRLTVTMSPWRLTTFRCETHGIDPVFRRGAGVGARPNGAICLTAPERTRDGERAARRGRTRGYAAQAVPTMRPAGLIGGAMVRRAYTQRSLVEVLLPDGDKLWDPTLRRIDAILDDDDLIDRMAEALAERHPRSRCRGRLGTPAAVVLRLLVLKHPGARASQRV